MADSVTEILLRARGDFSDLTGKISGLRKEFQNLKLPKDITANLEKGFNRLDPILKSYQKQLDKGFKTKTDLKNFEATRHELDAIFSDITSEIQKVNGQPVQLKADLKEIDALDKKLNKLGEDLQKKLNNISIDKGSKVTQGLDKIVESAKKASTIKPMTIKAQALFDTQDFAAYNSEIDKMQNKILSLSNKSGAKIDLARALGFKGETFTKEGEAITSQIERVDTLIKNFFNSLKVSDHAMGGLEKTNAEIVQTGEALNRVKTDSLEKGIQALSDFGVNAQQASQQAKGLGDSIDGAASSSVRMADELQQLKTSTQYFFSLRNMLNLFKRGVSEAVDVIKELDAAMTETAVVTDFSVGDMWKKLPEYTANANALGASVKDMYEATTLYYQQGLETDAAMGIANETMKMARIGGLEAADATDKMTAALRGFNMTLDEASAQRVNDVYSNLAAKTASDTEELGTAMQRTASIAASAGMSFEGTAAFLAQAIETTREPAENLGTAMKTIVARFTELKKNPLEISEVDGEEVDYNKVDTALKSIGVSLKDANGQFRNLDQVFLDIAQRWDGLTQTQQRYVATQAAGSRQQSRFIAMMSNYERTVELMDYANNSAGASNEQFGKTMESLEAKLNKLKNAWNEFLMGIMNDSMTKFVVDAGTKLLDILNNITDALSFGGKSGLLKSITSLTAAFIGLKTAGKLINFGVDKVGGLLNPNTPLLGFGGGHGEKISKTTTTIVNPIVAEIRQVVAAIKGQGQITRPGNTVSGTVEQYKASQATLKQMLGLSAEQRVAGVGGASNAIKYSDITGELKNLSSSQQRQLMGTLPGLQQAMRRGTLDLLKVNNVSKDAQLVGQQITKDIVKGMNKGSISVERGIELLRNPQKWGEIFGNQFNEGYLKEISNAVTGPEYSKLIEEARQKYINTFKENHGRDATEEELAKVQSYFEKYAKERSSNKAPIEEFDYAKYNRVGDSIGLVGSKFATAGQSVQQFGILLSNIGFEKAGTAIMRLGASISSLGMAFNGLGTFVTGFSKHWIAGLEAMEAAKAARAASGGMSLLAPGGTAGSAFAQGFLAGIPKPLLAAGIAAAVIGAVALISSHIEKKAREAGEEVRKQFEEGFTKADEKISSLEGYESRFNELAKGVDQFGHNISLSAEDYNEYLSISRELQQLSPSLIAGYNAEGEAIIKKGSAIRDVINKLKEEKQAELDSFTSNSSINKLIGEYQTSDAYKSNKSFVARGDSFSAFSREKATISGADNNDLNFKGIDVVNQLTGWNLDSLSNLTTTQLSWLSKHYNDVINLVEEQNGTLEDEVREGYVDAFTSAGSAINDVMTEGKPIIDAMQMWMGDQKLDAIGLGLGEEFSNSFNQGVEGIMLTGLTEGWTSAQFKDNLKNYSTEWNTLAGSTSKYTRIMEEAKDIQNQYLDSMTSDGAIQDYNKDIAASCNQLLELADNTDTATAAGQAFQQQCIEQANALRTYATEGGESLTDTLNTAIDEIQQAESALDSFNEATKTDLYTAAEGMKSIYDKAFETYEDSYGGKYEKHFEGSGDNTAWEAGRSILDEDVLKSIPSGKDLRDKLKEWEPALREGEEGWYEFRNKIVNDEGIQKNLEELADAGVKLDESGFLSYIPEDQWANVAKAIGISEEMLTSMLNKGRQFADIDFTNWAETRHTLETGNQSILGTTTNDKGQRKLFVKESTFEASLSAAGYRPEQYEDKKEQGRQEQNLEYLKAASEYNAKELQGIFKDEMGFQSLTDLVSGLASTGDFTREEIQDYAEKAGYQGDFDTIYNKIAEAIDNPELHKQTSVLEKISGQIDLLNAKDTTPDKASTDRDEWAREFYGAVGEAGKRIIDSEADYFARGQNKDGGNLSVEQYEATKKSLEAQQAWAEQQANQAEARAASASDTEEAAQWQAVADQWREDAANIGTYLSMAAEAFAKAQQENQLVQDATQNAVDLNNEKASNEEIKTAMIESAQKMADAQMKPEDIAAALNQSYGTNLTSKDVSVDKEGKVTDLTLDESKLQEQLNNLTANIKGNITDITFNGAALASGQNNPNSVFHRYGTMARGSRRGYTISGRPTLTGEEGEELVWEPKRNQAYMVGSNGPQFANISKDAVVWNAEQTKRIKKNSKVGSVGTGARGIYHLGTMANGRFGTMAGGTGMTIPGTLDINAMANIQDVVPPTEEPTIPVKADLQVEGANEGGLLNNLLGKQEGGPSINVAANVTTLNTTEQSKTVNLIGNITDLKNAATNNNINATATVTQVTKAPQVAGEPIQVKATATTTKVENKEKAPKQSASTQTMNVTANTASAQAKINKLVSIFNKTYTLKYTASGPRSISVPISANFTGSWRKTVEISKGSGANGINNRGFGSLAKGTGHGTVGPNNKGGLTLTGERGFEIAWLPSENRSMILGANGPQMLNLPKDAVVFTNEQSKKILAQKAIPAGSHDAKARITYDASQSRYARISKTGKSSTGKKNKKSKKSKKKKEKTKADINNFSIEEVVQFNIDQELTRLADQIARRTKDIEKALGKIGTTYNDILGSTQAQLGALQSVKDQNEALYNSYARQLADYRSQQTYISYTTSKGKSKQQKINIGDYLNADGSANYAAIAAAGGREVQEAIFKVVNSAGSMVDGMNKAKKAIDDANDQIEEFHKKIADTFYNWENQITWVYNLTQRLNNIQSLRDRFSEHITLELDKVSTGFETTAQALNEISVAAKRDNKALLEQIAAQREMINARKMEMEDAYSWADEQKELSYQLSKNADQGIINQAETNLEAAKMMRNYIKSFQQREDGSIVYDIDWAQFEQDKRDTKITNTTYDAIYKQLEKLNSSTTEYNNSLKDLTSSVDQIYQNILEYQQTQVDLESDLLDGLEEQTEQDVSNLKDLSSSISDALQDLLDSVKRKLDERRQQEDNAKTERDISQKQQRLAALRANTAGGNQVEIAQLEKEIAESQQSYQRSLEDQLLDRLNQQADEAAKQRERQIDLLETANKIGIDNRELVRKWVENPQDYQTEITNVLKNKENFGEAGFLRQEQILREINKRIVEGQNASDQLRAEGDRTDVQAQLDAESAKQKELEGEKAVADEKLATAQSELTQAITKQTDNQNALNSVNSSISSKQSELNKLKNRPEYRQYQKAQEAYAQYQKEYEQNKKNKYDEYGRRNYHYMPQLSFEQYTRKYGYRYGIDNFGYPWNYEHEYKQIQALEASLESLQNQKQNLTSQTASIQEAVAQAEESVKQLQDESNNWAQQIAQSQQTQEELQNKITAITTDSLLGVKDVADEQLNIKADTSYFNTNGAIVHGTDKLTPEVQAEKDYAITKQEKDRRDAEEAARKKAEADAAAAAAAPPSAPSPTPLQGLILSQQDFNSSKNSKAQVKALQQFLNILGYKGSNGKKLAVDGDFGTNTKHAFQAFKKDHKAAYGTDPSNYGFGGGSRKAVAAYGYKTGGLADYTGPAWLDGTPSKPELVLNSTDTKNFLALRDVLSNAMKSTGAVTNSYGGDIMYDINIHVDKIEKDYDVDKVVDKVKKEITKGAGYRNVTQVRNFK